MTIRRFFKPGLGLTFGQLNWTQKLQWRWWICDNGLLWRDDTSAHLRRFFCVCHRQWNLAVTFFLSILPNELGSLHLFPESFLMTASAGYWSLPSAFNEWSASKEAVDCNTSSLWMMLIFRLMPFPNWPLQWNYPSAVSRDWDIAQNQLAEAQIDKPKIIFIGQRKQLKGTSNMTPACITGEVYLSLVLNPVSACCRTCLVESTFQKHLFWIHALLSLAKFRLLV